MKTLQIAAIALLVGGALGYSANHFLAGSNMGMDAKADSGSSDSTEPLYWVAPMDPNYKRDKPGKSPMGMDLIPVYAEDMAGEQDKPGTITIDPSVENNLGVKSEPVTLEPLSPRIETVGYIAFDESQLWQTNVRVAGWVEKLLINAIGEKVNKGDVLFTLYSPELVKAQEELLNASRTGRTGLVKGATERLVTLGVDRAQIKAILKRGKASQTIEIKAPANGVIASLSIREGGYLSPAQAVISAGPLNNVWVDAEVFERQAQWIKAGSEASMTLDAIPGNEWQGKVDYVYPILDPNTRTLRVRLKFPNPDGELKPNMFANIALQPVSEESVLTIPKSAVIRSGGMARIVLSQGQGKYRSARIETGREAGDRVEVLQGLTQNDHVVTSAHFMLDSESSQSADLARINGVEPDEETVWAKGEITDVMADHGMLTINHQPVPEWDWPGMIMNFTLAKDVEASAFTTGQSIEFEMQKTESGQYEIVDYKVDDSVVAGELWLQGDISMLMADFGMITLNHLPVAEWNWQAGEMNFSVGDEVDLMGFEEGQRVRFLVERQGADYLLKQLATDEG
ncbi:efflux RND transporter periplasmic adaptor subunit [Vibrio neptunius]|uniref:Efflux RND transporter periplasmic adaptor subunit n=1 Tax=Vibrio neptunius TaxID=170651 RepID=A0ABS3A6X9_9VIBR|nr:efflux RND transporter periplasmic adaptor subunit [Vibrio neptunius]MBN3495283.1 efflux RND transporter periplasmic adaptor subunit [Vibrio neptunius]MBN3517785.1 efflux RND transporter periplasmic adaptor subunit [Vibrio neptunius]MBN3552065.1 efflux RND transporter periplasmic adaptor subunit [Vibrio neptunius]MBN3580098.1 efflux RND transporter periplasmic adaptor subunit [Vibrio neptunius]MCH9873764.1 efflux RND transporter periplasmic adaptor subunit [Vibrio neptunius]